MNNSFIYIDVGTLNGLWKTFSPLTDSFTRVFGTEDTVSFQ